MRKVSIMLAALALFTGHAAAQTDFPSRPITIIVPFAAGGPTDTVARLIAESMTQTLGQQVIVENAGGAGGTIGATRVARAKPDGYTLLLHHIGHATSATLYRKLPYDPAKDFAGIGLITDVPMTLIAKPDFGPGNIGELIAHLKANKEKVTLANAGLGSVSHLCGMLLQEAVGAQMTTVPYRGTGPAMNDIMGGQVDLVCDQTTNTTGPISAGKVKAYAVTTRDRLKTLPNLPTLESVREHHAGLQSLRSMRRIEARRRKASALQLRFSQSLASRRQRFSQAMVRSTIQRFGRTTNPFA
jgi:tripartite-type tricarboxylate transporter receptor subunit TctC